MPGCVSLTTTAGYATLFALALNFTSTVDAFDRGGDSTVVTAADIRALVLVVGLLRVWTGFKSTAAAGLSDDELRDRRPGRTVGEGSASGEMGSGSTVASLSLGVVAECDVSPGALASLLGMPSGKRNVCVA
eukprot:PhM_4_TR16165/c7_g1_i1/m.24567